MVKRPHEVFGQVVNCLTRIARESGQLLLRKLREHVLEFTNPFTAEAKLALARKVDEKIGKMKNQQQ